MTLTPLILASLLAISLANAQRDGFSGADKPVEHISSSVSSSSSSNQYTPGNGGSNQGNLYYYYSPTSDKGKEQSFHVAPSNNYASSAVPSRNDDTLKASSSGGGQDMSYNSPEMNSYEHYTGDYGSNPTFNGQSGSANFGGDGGGNGGNSGGNNGAPVYGEQNRPNFSGSGSPSNLMPTNYHPDETSAGSFSSLASQFDADFNSAVASQLSQHGISPYQPYGKNIAYGNYPQASNQQQPTYETAPAGYRRYGLSSILMPMLALAGLSLLIPTVSSLGTAATAGRRRRSVDSKDSAIIGYIDRIERYTSLCKAALEREECMNRIICELGDAMSAVRGKSTLFAIVDRVAPTWMGNKIGALKNGALSNDLTKCKRYSCQRKK